ncbi:type 2 isopentenyl-diphosphate Delta-isomerase [Candidatus Uabimicrobium sp. HlEnr_7]|uniref:type 2 isopentenyl-diphosphate Delta-isomerase n=1 Tax=Candidatus Uabimicrobium helgolandensis TaxID=3095367 RepID=UPI00355887BC
MSNLSNRKQDHIDIVLNENTEPISSSFDKYYLPYCALPEIDMGKIDPSTTLLNKTLSFPFIISSMTGGLEKGEQINKNLAIAAQQEKVALGLGSMRVIIRYPEMLKTFQVREHCPDVPLFANIGIVQLNYGFTAQELKKIIDGVQADALFVHINHLQEAIQPEGDTNFENLIPKLEKVISQLNVPVFAKEVGHGIDYNTAKRLRDIGVKYIDVSGMGGCSWAWIEGYRLPDSRNLGHTFRAEGIPTDHALKICSKLQDITLIAGGGIRSGLDVAKSLTMGASYATAAKPFLDPALKSSEAVARTIQQWKKEFIVALFTSGASNVNEMSDMECLKRD